MEHVFVPAAAVDTIRAEQAQDGAGIERGNEARGAVKQTRCALVAQECSVVYLAARKSGATECCRAPRTGSPPKLLLILALWLATWISIRLQVTQIAWLARSSQKFPGRFLLRVRGALGIVASAAEIQQAADYYCYCYQDRPLRRLLQRQFHYSRHSLSFLADHCLSLALVFDVVCETAPPSPLP